MVCRHWSSLLHALFPFQFSRSNEKGKKSTSRSSPEISGANPLLHQHPVTSQKDLVQEGRGNSLFSSKPDQNGILNLTES